MRLIIFVILFLLGIPYTFTKTNQINYKKTSLAVIAIDNTINGSFDKLVRIPSQNKDYSLEYSCNISGIIIYRIDHSFMDKADVIQYIKKTIHKSAKDVKFEIIFVDIQDVSNKGKC